MTNQNKNLGVTTLELLIGTAVLGAMIAGISVYSRSNRQGSDRQVAADQNMDTVFNLVHALRQDLRVATGLTGTATQWVATYSYLNTTTNTIDNGQVTFAISASKCTPAATTMNCKDITRTDSVSGANSKFTQIKDFTWCIEGNATTPACPAIGKIATTQTQKRFIGMVTMPAGGDVTSTDAVPFVIDLENVPITLAGTPKQVELKY